MLLNGHVDLSKKVLRNPENNFFRTLDCLVGQLVAIATVGHGISDLSDNFLRRNFLHEFSASLQSMKTLPTFYVWKRVLKCFRVNNLYPTYVIVVWNSGLCA